jgi:hypothetical protein
MELKLFKEIGEGLSMETRINGTVEEMEPVTQLKMMMEMGGDRFGGGGQRRY